MSTVTLRLIENFMMSVTGSNGHSVVVGRSPDPQFQYVGIKPSELLLMAAASCSAYDVVDILSKQRQPFDDLRVECTGNQEIDPPYRFTQIDIHFIVKGDVNPKKLERAISLSTEKYCSVLATLKPGVSIHCDFEIVS